MMTTFTSLYNIHCIYLIQAKYSMADHQVSELGDSQWQLKPNKKANIKANIKANKKANIRANLKKEKPDHSVPGVESIQ